MDIIVIGLGDASQEVHGVGEAHVVLEGCEDVTFGIKNLLIREGLIGDMAEVGDVRGEHLLILRSNEHGGDTNELKTVKGDNFSRQEAIDDVDGEEQGLGEQTETGVHFDKPVDKDPTHLPFKVGLVVDVIRVGESHDLKVPEILKDFNHVFSGH